MIPPDRSPPEPRLTTERLSLTLPIPEDAAANLAYAGRNREHLAFWSPPEPEGALTLGATLRRIDAARRSFEAGSAVSLDQ